jgi:hypothetical protein
MTESSQELKSFLDLPRRIFLDSSTFQTLQDYGEFIFEHADLPPHNRGWTIPDFYEELESLQAIFFANRRALFEFALSRRSFEEVAAKGDPWYLQWAYDVLDYWEACLESYSGEPFAGRGLDRAKILDSPSFGYLSMQDRLLLQDALALECDAFLTMERRLPKNAAHIRRTVGLSILRPHEYWDLLRLWARLYT